MSKMYYNYYNHEKTIITMYGLMYLTYHANFNQIETKLIFFDPVNELSI